MTDNSTQASVPRPSLASQLSFAERLFSTGDDRKVLAAIDDGVARLEDRLVNETQFHDSLADIAARYLLQAGGKRVRPILAMLVAQLGDGVNDNVITAATSIEITHLASLYHDDVMDEAPERRGVPTAQHVWGNSVAILVGDLLFARASKLLSLLGEDAIRLQADTFERLCMGQLHETTGPGPLDDPIEFYIRVLSDKTGSLIAAAAQLGAIFGNVPHEQELAVIEFGEKIGIAFQLIDDVIDLSPSSDVTGKVAGTDIRAGVATLPLLYLRKEAEHDADAAALLDDIQSRTRTLAPGETAVEVETHDDPILDAAITRLREHEVTARTQNEANRWADEAIAALAPLPNGTVKKALTRFAESVVHREG